MNDLNSAISIFVLVITMNNLPASYCMGLLSDMILTSDRWASKWRRTSTTAVLQAFMTGKSHLVEASALCQVLTSWFILGIFSGEGIPRRSLADERMLDLMWLTWASIVWVCWLCSALLDDNLVGHWLEAGLWLTGNNVGSKILECGVTSESRWNSSPTTVIIASDDNEICCTLATIAWKELSSDDAESGGAQLLQVALCIEGSSSSVVAKNRALAASASWAWACWTAWADWTFQSRHSYWMCSIWVCSWYSEWNGKPKGHPSESFPPYSALGSSTCAWWRLRWVAGDEWASSGQETETPGVCDPLSGLIWLWVRVIVSEVLIRKVGSQYKCCQVKNPRGIEQVPERWSWQVREALLMGRVWSGCLHKCLWQRMQVMHRNISNSF